MKTHLRLAIFFTLLTLAPLRQGLASTDKCSTSVAQKQIEGAQSFLKEDPGFGALGRFQKSEISISLKKAIKYYTGFDGHSRMNRTLDDKSSFYLKVNHRIGLVRDFLDEPTGLDGFVYSGRKLLLSDLAAYKVGSTHSFGYFFSTTLSKETAVGFSVPAVRHPPETHGSVVFTIKSKTGKSISWYSKFQEGEEVLISPDARFNVT